MDELKSLLDNLTTHMKSLEINLSNKIDCVDQKISNFQREVEDIKSTQSKQEKRLDVLEKQIRARNLVIFGVEEMEKSYHQLEDIVIKIINNNVKIQCSNADLEHLRRLGKKGEKPRPIIFGLTTLGLKIKILKNKNNLKDSGWYIKEDYSPKVLAVRKSLQENLQKELSEGKKARIIYDKLIIYENKQNETPSNISGKETSYQPSKRHREISPIQNKDKQGTVALQNKKKSKTFDENRGIAKFFDSLSADQEPKRQVE